MGPDCTNATYVVCRSDRSSGIFQGLSEIIVIPYLHFLASSFYSIPVTLYGERMSQFQLEFQR
jgi:hypothetical protein